MSAIAWIIFLLFFPSTLGILGQILGGNELSHQLLALGLLLFSLEQARMAVVDLQQVAVAKKQFQDVRLDSFYTITISTIVIELLGFYTAAIWLGWGILLVLLSQVWFNLFAKIQIQLSPEVAIQSCGISQRYLVLIGDVLGLILIALWMLKINPLGIVLGLWGMAIVYGSVKYIYSE